MHQNTNGLNSLWKPMRTCLPEKHVGCLIPQMPQAHPLTYPWGSQRLPPTFFPGLSQYPSFQRYHAFSMHTQAEQAWKTIDTLSKTSDRNILLEIIIETKKNGSMYVCVWGVLNREITVYKLSEGWKRKMGIWGILIWEEKEFVNTEGDGNSKK